MSATIHFDENDPKEMERIRELSEYLAKGKVGYAHKEYVMEFSKHEPGLAVIYLENARDYELFTEEVIPAAVNWAAEIELADVSQGVSQKGKKRLFVDMDGTLAEFRNVEFIEQLFEQGYFRNLKPQENVVDAVKILIEEHEDVEVYVLSAILRENIFAMEEKLEWLDEYLPEIDENHRLFVECGEDKGMAVLDFSENDFLLDDYTANLLAWNPPGRAIKLLNNINHTRGTWKEDCIRFDRPGDEIADLLYDVIAKGGHCYDRKPEPESPALTPILF